LSRADIRLLERAGHNKKEFALFNRQGFAQLRNRRGHCVFYQIEKCRCEVYRFRPLGCRIYPIIYSEEDGVIVDDLCPQAGTVSETEIDSKRGKLAKLLRRIDIEAKKLEAGACVGRLPLT